MQVKSKNQVCRQEAASQIALAATPSIRGNPTAEHADGNACVVSSQDNVGKSENAEALENPSVDWKTLKLCDLGDLRVDKSLVFTTVQGESNNREVMFPFQYINL